jgi:hypothetical protein
MGQADDCRFLFHLYKGQFIISDWNQTNIDAKVKSLDFIAKGMLKMSLVYDILEAMFGKPDCSLIGYRNWWGIVQWITKNQHDPLALKSLGLLPLLFQYHEGAPKEYQDQYNDEHGVPPTLCTSILLLGVEFRDFVLLEMLWKLYGLEAFDSFTDLYLVARTDLVWETSMIQYSPRPIDIAAAFGYLDVVKWLVDKGVNVGVGGRDMELEARDFAQEYKRQNVVDYLNLL